MKLEVNPILNYLHLEDPSGKVLNLVLSESGEVLVTVPSGTPGRLKVIARISRDDAREFAKGVIELVGVGDS